MKAAAVDSPFGDPTIGALNQSLNLRLMNQNVIASNIANADTPAYRSQALEFERAFREALQASGGLPAATTHPAHVGRRRAEDVRPEIGEDPNGVESLDGNTVDRADEMARMAENQILYDSSVEMLRKKLGMLKYAVTEGGGNR